ncbi:MAG: type 2 isopentenyl-diphosphate Delta-isomerase [Candidatus Bathyarchaeota archaeon]|jgi:isopentenyl-diphosphate delta-isomerase|nr:MAG: type 2 isopentenyl-diphosphate Delta-isomerase [Candidatus Bathyarchaeota archaeon]
MSDSTENRKADHIRIPLEKDVGAKFATTGFEDTFLVHNSLPELDRGKIQLATKAFGHDFSAPILAGAMTGGTRKAETINGAIAEAVEKLGLGMGVGSQRAALENPKLESTYKIVREKAPTSFVIANIGAPQLAKGYGLEEAEKAVSMIEADALAIHLNPLQEAIQLEGETRFKGVLLKIEEIAEKLAIPLIVKETGAGISAEVAEKLEEVGVKGIDVSGAGGISWAAVEFYRAKNAQDSFHQQLGEDFWDWGIPTAASLVEASQSSKLTLIASGGIANGIDAAKALALGASLASMSTPLLLPATKSSREVKKTLAFIIEELRNTMFLTGSETVDALKKTPAVLLGKTAAWLRQRGFNPEAYARRKK